MGIMNVEKPIRSIIEAAKGLDEDLVYENFSEAINILELDDDDQSLASIVRESKLADLANSSMPCLAIIGAMKNYVKKNYAIQAQRLENQSKEVNDLYTKIKYLTTHDKFARFWNRNKLESCTLKDVVLFNKNDNKYYLPDKTDLSFNPEFFSKLISDKMHQLDRNQYENEDQYIEAWVNSYITDLNIRYDDEWGWYENFEPTIRAKAYVDVKIKDILEAYEGWFDASYKNIGRFNRMVSDQISMLQLIEKSYKDTMVEFGTTKARKTAVDIIFKRVIWMSSRAIDFNNRMAEIYTELIQHYSNELERIYSVIKEKRGDHK